MGTDNTQEERIWCSLGRQTVKRRLLKIICILCCKVSRSQWCSVENYSKEIRVQQTKVIFTKGRKSLCSKWKGRKVYIYEKNEQMQNLFPEVNTRNFFWSPQLQFHNLKEARLQSQFRNFLKKCCSATTTLQFPILNFFWSPQLESFTFAIFSIFLALE